ncbi:hypothetical protein C8R48DRAFT_776849 [Suillus tomentosus]|nr:hypothetical protein C8R48DRAFT_776849 [Suillus tomentosus]
MAGGLLTYFAASPTKPVNFCCEIHVTISFFYHPSRHLTGLAVPGGVGDRNNARGNILFHAQLARKVFMKINKSRPVPSPIRVPKDMVPRSKEGAMNIKGVSVVTQEITIELTDCARAIGTKLKKRADTSQGQSTAQTTGLFLQTPSRFHLPGLSIDNTFLINLSTIPHLQQRHARCPRLIRQIRAGDSCNGASTKRGVVAYEGSGRDGGVMEGIGGGMKIESVTRVPYATTAASAPPHPRLTLLRSKTPTYRHYAHPPSAPTRTQRCLPRLSSHINPIPSEHSPNLFITSPPSLSSSHSHLHTHSPRILTPLTPIAKAAPKSTTHTVTTPQVPMLNIPQYALRTSTPSPTSSEFFTGYESTTV